MVGPVYMQEDRDGDAFFNSKAYFIGRFCLYTKKQTT